MAQSSNNLDYLEGKEVFTLSYSEAKKINEFDMILYKKQNPKLEIEINSFISSAANNPKIIKYSLLTLAQKEEVLKRMFIEKEENSIEENFTELETEEENQVEEISEIIEENQVEEFEIDLD